MKRFKRVYWGVVLAIMAALTVGCTTQTKEEIKVIDGHRFLCTWTESADAPWAKTDYRCEAFQG